MIYKPKHAVEEFKTNVNLVIDENTYIWFIKTYGNEWNTAVNEILNSHMHYITDLETLGDDIQWLENM